MVTRLKCVALALILFALVRAIQPSSLLNGSAEDLPRRSERLGKVLSYYKTLNVGQYRDYLRGLARQRDFEALQAIYNSNIDFSDLAAEETVKILDSAEVVKFCEQFPRGSMNWRSAFLAFQHHPKSFVIEYVKQVILDPKPRVRYCCYTLCRLRHWNDLIDNAQGDLNNKCYLGLPNEEYEIVLGDSAQLYLDSCAGIKRREILPPVVIPDPDK